jgi:hypothetical protein
MFKKIGRSIKMANQNGMFNSVTGDTSSKRVMGVVYLGIGLLMAVVDQFTDYNISSFEIWAGILVTGGSLLGLGLFEYFGKKEKPTPPTQ